MDHSGFGPPVDPIAPLRLALRGHYEIEREIGQGAFATVYRARDLKHERKVAIKVLNADPSSDTGELRFIREIRMLARLQHPNILPLHDSGHVEALLYYVMPYVTGETLRSRIERERQLPIEDAVCIAQEAADALAYAHGQGIIHRDIKPENILLSGGHAIVADFGIARAIDIAGIRQLTRTGLGSPGTPAYMAPEQLLGDRGVDARSDIYSLGCVLYEMLTGKPPFAGKEGFVKRFTEAPPTPSRARAGLPTWLDDVISMALARNPAERYGGASDLARALALGLALERATPVRPTKVVSDITTPDSGPERQRPAAPTPSTEGPQRSETPWPWIRRHPAVSIAAGTLLAVLTVVLLAQPSLVRSPLGNGTNLDPTRFAILPLATDERAEEAFASHATDKLYDAFRAWEGLNLVPDLKVDEAVSRAGQAPKTLADAIAVARTLGAGQLVWGHIVRSGDSFRPRAELYDVRSPNNTVREILLDADTPEGYAKTAVGLLAPKERPPAALGGDGLTHNYIAWSAYNRGHLALADWDVGAAQAEFAAAVAADPSFPVARLWLGQLRAWRNPTAPQSWRDHVDRAAAAAPSMSQRDRALALALSAMATKRFPDACENYRKLIQLDSNDFVGWYGLGDCQSLDGTVVPDRASVSGFRWRSSYDAAVKSFLHALRVEPRAHALLSFARLRRLLPTAAANPRTDDPDSPRFAAVPSLTDADTIAFVPYPVAVFRQGLPPAATQTLNRALSRDLDVLFRVVRDWVQVTPNSPDAYESLADLLETTGDIADRGSASGSAAAATRKAYTLSTDSLQRLRLVVRLARLQFKRGEYAAVRTTTDSLLGASRPADANVPPALVSLTAVTGKAEATAQEVAAHLIPDQLDGIALGSALRNAAGELFSYAALGVCGDALNALQVRLEQQLGTSIADDQRSKVRAALLSRPLSMMVPCTKGESALSIVSSTGSLALLQRAFARNDRAGIDRAFQTIARIRRVYRPGDVSLDRTYQEAWIRVAIGDTAAAERQLDESLNAIPTMSPSSLQEVGSAAAAGRLMALRADLAAARGNSAVAHRWASAVVQLWGSADPPLQPTVTRMRTIAATSR
jgi:serine/threonine protein kinase/tetratricopeptide (TPR) repeat protein